MNALGFWDWLAYGTIMSAAVIIAIDTAIAQSKHLKDWRLLKGIFGFLPLILILAGTGAFAYKQFGKPTEFSLPKDAESGSPFAVVQGWGMDNNVFYTIIRTKNIMENAKIKKLLLVVRVNYSDIDMMTDTKILKSQSYTLLQDFMTLAIPQTYNNTLMVPVDRPVSIQFNVVEIPFLFSSDDIKSLSDVPKIGGSIIASPTTITQFKATPTNPPDACPPLPVRPMQRGKT